MIKPLSGCEFEIEFVVPAEEFNARVEGKMKELRSGVTLPGFRPGKVPMNLFRRRFGKAVEAEELEKMSNDLFREAMEERNIQPIGHPHMHDLNFKPGEPVSIKVHYETAPEVVARDYTGIPVERVSHEVSDEEIDREVEYFRNRERILEEAQKAEDENSLVTVDLQMLDASGVPMIGRRSEDVKLHLGDEHVNRELKAELFNMRSGEEKQIELTYEGKEGVEEREHVRVLVKRIEKVILPEVNDAFAERVTKGAQKTVAELRAHIRESLERLYASRATSAMEGELVNEIVKRNEFDVPPSVVESFLQHYIEQLKNQNPNKTLPPDFDEKAFREARRGDAIWQARWMFLRESIIGQEKLTVEDADVDELAERQAKATNISKERLVQFLLQSEETRDSILSDKLIRFLTEKAVVTERSDDETDDVLIKSLAP